MMTTKKCIEALSRRRNYLLKRIKENSSKELSYDKYEAAALTFAINALEQTLPV